MMKKNKVVLVFVTVLLIIILGVGGYAGNEYAKSHCLGWYKNYPRQQDQNATAARVVEVLNFEWPLPSLGTRTNWITDLQQDYGALEGCRYEVENNTVKRMSTSEKEFGVQSDSVYGIAVEQVTTGLWCFGEKVNTLKIDYYADWDASGYGIVIKTGDVKVV